MVATVKVMTSTYPLGTLGSVASLLASSGGFRGGRAGRAPPPKIRKAYVIQR
jgi:hypothetical protein